MKVSGYCYPCKDIKDAALVVQIEKTNISEEEDINNVIKMGKEAGIWYVIVKEQA